jgi:DNA-binding NarL/FixJ family response regulator
MGNAFYTQTVCPNHLMSTVVPRKKGIQVPETILIVEDHDDVRRALQDWLALEFPQCNVLEAASGEEAIALTRIESPCMIVMDIRLPGINGIEAARRIKATSPSAQIVMLTIHTGHSYHADATAAGASAYVTKKAMHAELVPTLAALIAGGHS